MCISSEIPQPVNIWSFHNYTIKKYIYILRKLQFWLLLTLRDDENSVGQPTTKTLIDTWPDRRGTAKNGNTVNETQPDQLRLKQDFQNCL